MKEKQIMIMTLEKQLQEEKSFFQMELQELQQ